MDLKRVTFLATSVPPYAYVNHFFNFMFSGQDSSTKRAYYFWMGSLLPTRWIRPNVRPLNIWTPHFYHRLSKCSWLAMEFYLEVMCFIDSELFIPRNKNRKRKMNESEIILHAWNKETKPKYFTSNLPVYSIYFFFAWPWIFFSYILWCSLVCSWYLLFKFIHRWFRN